MSKATKKFRFSRGNKIQKPSKRRVRSSMQSLPPLLSGKQRQRRKQIREALATLDQPLIFSAGLSDCDKAQACVDDENGQFEPDGKKAQAQLDYETRLFEAKALERLLNADLAEPILSFAETPFDAASLLLQHGGGGRSPLASCVAVRHEFAKAVRKALKRHKKQSPKMELFTVTIVLSSDFTSDERTTVDIEGLVRRARRLLNKLGRDYVAATEIQVMTNERAPEGGKVACHHVHALMFGNDVYHHAKAIAASINDKSPKLPFGGKVVDIGGSCKTEGSWRRVTAYPFRLKPKCKTLYIHPVTGDRNLHESVKGDRKIRYERLLEILSSYEYRDTVFASGHGRAIKTAAMKKALTNIRHLPPRPTLKKIRRFWKDRRESTKMERFKPVVVKVRPRRSRR